MKKIFLAFLLSAVVLPCLSQTYNNEWIDYNKTYYKFRVGSTGLYRISQASLSSLGLAGTNAKDFQLWHDGQEVPVYTSVSNGVLGSTDYIEFYGLMNDGKLDTKLYKEDDLQMCDKYSLYTDSSAYFLTVNTTTINQRMINDVNDVVSNTLGAEPYFIHKLQKYFRTRMNPGFGYDLGELINAASYEVAEGWTTNGFGPGGSFYDNNNNLYLYSSGPAASLYAVVTGNKDMNRVVDIKLNGVSYVNEEFYGFYIRRYSINNIALSTLSNNYANIEFRNSGTTPGDELVVSNYEIDYPRQFNFGGQSQFEFELAASDTGKYLAINNFNYGGGIPVLYDLTDNIRLTAVVSSGITKFVLPPSLISRKFVLLSTDLSSVKSINNFSKRNFINYSLPANQSNYLIISNQVLFDDGSGNNNVEKYRQYRSSAAGGNYTAKIYDIEQLTDQFSFGIKHHPSAIRNFSAYTSAKYSITPKYFFLIGKGLNYYNYKNYESDRNIDKQALVPTFGYPASDNLLTASRTGEYPLIPIGRLSAISGKEVGDYLDMVKQFELIQLSTSQTVADKAWTKNIAQLTGGLDDPGLESLITNYMQGYESLASDTLFGGKVYQFVKNTGLTTATGTDKTLPALFKEGLSVLTYFGHSSPNIIEFNMDNPENYNNTGKYPLMVINGCVSGNLFEFDTLRAVSKGTLSEKFIFAPNKGSIAYIATTQFGLPAQLNFVNKEFYSNLYNKMYGQTLGQIMQTTMKNVFEEYGKDYITQTHVEEITLHGDPALSLNPHAKPDYIIQDSLVSFDPAVVSIADNKVTVTVKIMNIGKAIKDSLPVKIQHTLPDNSVVTLFNGKIKAVKFMDSIRLVININPIRHTGINYISVFIDPENKIDELSENNNTITKSFTVIKGEIRPVWPYQYAIVNDPNVAVYGSTADPLAEVKEYVMQMDTTALFNSAFKMSKTIIDSGGVIKFVPGIVFKDSTVYYWRVALGPVDAATHWTTSSFVYITSSDEGYNQSHYYQYKNDNFSKMTIDSISRKLGFENRVRRLLIRTGLNPYYNWDQININIDADRVDQYGCRYNSLQFVVYDPLTLKPWQNYNVGAGNGRFGSLYACGDQKRNFFEFPFTDINYRKKAMQFFDSIPAGYYVTITNLGTTGNNSFINNWKADTTSFGSGKSLWHKFKQYGLTQIESFTTNLPFLFAYRQGDTTSFPISQSIGPTSSNQIVDAFDINGKEISGSITTPWLGPAKEWKKFKWGENTVSSPNTQRRFDIIGKNGSGDEIVLANVYNSKDTSLSFIDSKLQPFLKLRIYNQDDSTAKTTQLKYWMLNGSEAPEGGVAPNMLFQMQDSLKLNDTLHFRVGFKNMSDAAFDSLKVRLTIIDNIGVSHIYNNLAGNVKIKPLLANDSVIIIYDVPVYAFPGQNQLILDVNPDNDQPEQYHFNNLLYSSFIVDNSICPGNNISFYAGTPVPGNTYKWQVNDGSGYKNIGNDDIYSGTSTATLLLANPPTLMSGYKYRCIVTNNATPLASTEFTLKFALIWTGAVNTLWEEAGNWTCNLLPDEFTDVIINKDSPNYPEITSNAVCKSITAQPNTTVTIKTGFNLDIKGSSGK